MTDVVALDSLRRPLEAERLLQLPQRDIRLAPIGQPAYTFLLERVVRIALRELRQVALLPSLWHVQARRPAAALSEERFKRRGLR